MDAPEPDWTTILTRKHSVTMQMQPQKALHERRPEEFAAIIIGSSLLCFNAGFMNCVTLLTSGMTASHVTGVITKSSIFLGDGSWADFGAAVGILPMFIMGSAVSGVLIPYSSFHLGRAYNLIFLLGSLCLLTAILCHVIFPDSNGYVYIVATACGMQNAMTTKYSNNILRTTHMTGAATDIGIVIGRIIMGRREELWRLYVLVPMMLCFFFGGMCGAQAAARLGVMSLVINLAIFAGTGLLYSIYISNSRHITLLKALFSRGEDIPQIPVHETVYHGDSVENPMAVHYDQSVNHPFTFAPPIPTSLSAESDDSTWASPTASGREEVRLRSSSAAKREIEFTPTIAVKDDV